MRIYCTKDEFADLIEWCVNTRRDEGCEVCPFCIHIGCLPEVGRPSEFTDLPKMCEIVPEGDEP